MAISHYQSTFATTPDEGKKGHPASTGEYLADSLTNDEAATAIGFGLGVKANGEDGCKLPASSADAIEGVTMHVPLIQPDANGDRKTPTDGVCLVMQRGRIWVDVEETVSKGDPVFVRHTANGAGKDPGQFRKDSDGSVGVKPQVSWTLSGALDAGQPRIQLLTFNQNFQAGDTVDLNINGNAIETVTFAISHANTADLMIAAIREQLVQDGIDAHIEWDDAPTFNVLRMASLAEPFSATAEAITGIAIGGGNGLTLTPSDAQAGAAPHTLTLDVDGDTITQMWAGNHDDTIHNFADELASHAKVESAEVTHVAAGNDLVITLTGANFAADDIDLTNGNPTGGANARTGALNNEVRAGIAVSSKAAQWTGARYVKGAAAGKNALLEVFGND